MGWGGGRDDVTMGIWSGVNAYNCQDGPKYINQTGRSGDRGMLSKQDAMEKIREKITRTYHLAAIERNSPSFEKWKRDTEIAIQNTFGENSRHVTDFRKVQYYLNFYSMATSDYEVQQAYVDGVEIARAVLESLITEIEEYWEEGSRDSHPDALSRIESICLRFHLVARELGNRHAGRTTIELEDEYNVQDLLRTLLAIDFDDVRPEEWAPSYAGGASRMDFLLKAEQIVVEVKKTRKSLGAKEVGEELLVDIARYQSHPDCKTLLCFVYDPEGSIRNPTGLESDLRTASSAIRVVPIIAPKGL